ncbi:hypothetical protein L9F63_001343 [Diploptera punctata]|uniref:Gustatory receptor n=1 Tax=Diploptera punctata TaxID=6984 RepID=A0AAD8A3S7_DIPPU|nr:hypothetical protein L9F63_001343 [Diploptera punctata]
MKVQGPNRVYQDLKSFILICKCLGMAPFTVRTTDQTGAKQLDTSIKRNLFGLICTLLVSGIMIFGITDIIKHLNPHSKFSAVDYVNKYFCFPMLFLMPLLAQVFNSTINKSKIRKLLKIFSNIDYEVQRLRTRPAFHDSKINKFLSHFDEIIFISIVINYMIYDFVIVGNRFTALSAWPHRIAEIANIALLLQYCKFVKFIWQRLSEFCEIVSQYFEVDAPDVEKQKLYIFQISKIHPTREVEKLHDVTEMLISLRRMYRQIYETVELLNLIYGFVIFLEITTNFAVIITNVSTIVKQNTNTNTNTFPRFPHFLHAPERKPLLAHCSWLFMSSLVQTIMIVLCEITIWKSKKLGTAVFKMSFNRSLEIETLQQLELLLNQIYNDSFDFTAFWLLSLNSNLLCTIFASSVTFALVLSQLT